MSFLTLTVGRRVPFVAAQGVLFLRRTGLLQIYLVRIAARCLAGARCCFGLSRFMVYDQYIRWLSTLANAGSINGRSRSTSQVG